MTQFEKQAVKLGLSKLIAQDDLFGFRLTQPGNNTESLAGKRLKIVISVKHLFGLVPRQQKAILFTVWPLL